VRANHSKRERGQITTIDRTRAKQVERETMRANDHFAVEMAEGAGNRSEPENDQVPDTSAGKSAPGLPRYPPEPTTQTGYVHTRRNLPYLIPNCEAKTSWAGLVLAWGTSREPHGDVTFFASLHDPITSFARVQK
jgi:hypothetical protein